MGDEQITQNSFASLLTSWRNAVAFVFLLFYYSRIVIAPLNESYLKKVDRIITMKTPIHCARAPAIRNSYFVRIHFHYFIIFFFNNNETWTKIWSRCERHATSLTACISDTNANQGGTHTRLLVVVSSASISRVQRSHSESYHTACISSRMSVTRIQTAAIVSSDDDSMISSSSWCGHHFSNRTPVIQISGSATAVCGHDAVMPRIRISHRIRLRKRLPHPNSLDILPAQANA